MKIAVVGAGISGIVAAHSLSRAGRGVEVTLFDADSRIGGHANPVQVEEQSESSHLDTGFVIFNRKSYPHFIEFLNDVEADFDVVQSSMSFGFSNRMTQFEYSTASLKTLFPSLGALTRIESYAILRDLYRFRRDSIQFLQNKDSTGEILGLYLSRYSKIFRDYFALPMVCLIWSMPLEEALLLPAQTFLEFLNHHGHFGSFGEKNWSSFRASSHQYLEAFKKSFKGRIRIGSPVTSLCLADNHQVLLKTNESEAELFDKVVVALHADDAFEILAEPTLLQQSLLAPWRYSSSQAYLHTDESVLTKNQSLWGIWNTTSTESGSFMTYYLNPIHGIQSTSHYFLTLNPTVPLAADKIIRSMTYSHPCLDGDAIERQKHLSQLNRESAIYFCGSYFGYGFHEDGARSAKMVADQILGLRGARGIRVA